MGGLFRWRRISHVHWQYSPLLAPVCPRPCARSCSRGSRRCSHRHRHYRDVLYLEPAAALPVTVARSDRGLRVRRASLRVAPASTSGSSVGTLASDWSSRLGLVPDRWHPRHHRGCRVGIHGAGERVGEGARDGAHHGLADPLENYLRPFSAALSKPISHGIFAALAGIGFTESLLIAELSRGVGSAYNDASKIAILTGSVIAAVIGATIRGCVIALM